MTGKPIGYVMEQTLGNITHYLNLRRAESVADVVPLWLPIEFRHSALPWTITGGRLARKEMIKAAPQVRGFFMHTTTLALPCADLFRRVPTVLSTDGTPLNKRNMRSAYGLRERGQPFEAAKRKIYRNVYAGACAMVGWSDWVKQSLVEDYGYPENDIAVVPPGVDVEQFKAGDRDHELPRILFVGGDFERKGGSLLLKVFQERFRGRAELILVTRDDVQAEPGVTVHRGLGANSSELRNLYATSDLFVLPTLADCFSLVLMEAMAASMPVIATRVGGIADIVRHGSNGYLVDPGDGDALGDAMQALIDDSALRRAMGAQGRTDALAQFDARENARRLFDFVSSRCLSAA